MADTSEFYRARAAECAAEARRALLDNVRERFLDAEAARLAMADRVSPLEAARKRRRKG